MITFVRHHKHPSNCFSAMSDPKNWDATFTDLQLETFFLGGEVLPLLCGRSALIQGYSAIEVAKKANYGLFVAKKLF